MTNRRHRLAPAQALHERGLKPLRRYRALDRGSASIRGLESAYDNALAVYIGLSSRCPCRLCYHTVWFELHEVLSAPLGRVREEQA